MDAIILAGGLGTRLRDTVPGVPKPLAPIAGKPFLDLLLSHLATVPNLNKVVLAIGHQAEQIVNRYTSHSFGNFEIAFSVENQPLGTGGALKLALPNTQSDNVLVLNGDSFLGLDWSELINSHKSLATLAAVHQPDVSRYGELITCRDTTFIQKFSEKGGVARPGLINGGIYLFRRSVVDYFPAQETFSIETDLFPKLLPIGIQAHEVHGKFIDIGTKDSYALAQKVLKDLTERS